MNPSYQNFGAASSSYQEVSQTSEESNNYAVSVLDGDGGKPSSTEELVGMLKNAGTELTVKYITGELNFEGFCRELEKRNRVVSVPGISQSKPAQTTGSIPHNIPMFDMLLESDRMEEVEGHTGAEEEMEVESEEESQSTEEDSADFSDAGETTDDKDEDWLPDLPRSRGHKGNKGREKRQEDGKMMRIARKPRRKQHELPRHLKSVQGRAMLLKAQGHTEEAMLLLFDIVKKAPKSAAPYQALGSLHEEKGDMKQALKFQMVAADLHKAEPKEWFELIDMCLKLDNEDLAITCYNRANKSAQKKSHRLEVMLHKCMFFEARAQPLKALQCREFALRYMDLSQPEAVLTFARDLAQDFLKCDHLNDAIDALEYLHKELPNSIYAEDIHLLVELLMTRQSYERSLQVLLTHCGISTDPPGEPSDILKNLPCISSVHVPEELGIDLKSKLVQNILLTKLLPSLTPLRTVIDQLMQEDVEEYGDIHFEVSETMVECGYHEDARPVLEALVASQSYGKAEVWLVYAHCLNALGNIHSAADAFTRVIQLAPSHYGARVTLSSLQQQMGNHEMALQVLTSDPSGDGPATFDQNLLLHKCQLLYSQGRTTEFISCSRKLLLYNMRGEFSPNFIQMLMGIKRIKSRQRFYDTRKLENPNAEGEDHNEINELEKQEQNKFKEAMWDVYLKLIKALIDKGDNAALLKTAAVGVTCPAWCRDEEKVKQAEFLCLKIGPVNQSVYNLARNLVHDEKEHNQAWNLYNYIVTKFKDIHDLRFAMRALMKNPDSLALGILNGNARLISGSYKLALGEYLAVFRQAPDCLAVLCCALCLLHITSQIHVARRNKLIPQVICFLNFYKEMRGECQETYYNIGRALYQINLHFAAIHYYKKALQFPPVIEDEEGTFDLTREIAFNMSQIYKKSKNYEAARYYIEKYCII